MLSNIHINIVTTLLVFVGVANLLLGLLITKKNEGKISNKFFVSIALSVSVWVISRVLFEISTEPFFVNLWVTALYVSAIFIPFFFLFFALFFSNANDEKVVVKRNFIFFTCGICLLVILVTLTPGVVIKSVNETIAGKVILFGWGYLLYGVYIVVYFLSGFIILLKKYFKANTELKLQLAYILLGTSISSLIGILTNLVLPVIGYFKLFWLGPVATSIMVFFIGYAIIKHHLFNIKLIAAELLTFAIWITMLVEALGEDTFNGKLFGFGTLFFAVVLGIFLIKSVKKEIAQHEQIEELAGRLKSVNRVMSHDIKNVLGKNKDMYGMLLDGTFGIIPDGAKPFLERLLGDTKQLVRSVISILESGQEFTLKLTPFDIKIPILEIIKDVSHDAEEKGLIIKTNIDETQDYTILGDEAQLSTRVFRNLIENAVNYTLAGSVTIGLSKKADKVIFSVADTGVGINEEDQKNLFQEGGHGKDSLKVNVHSTGYGLFSAKKVVDAHGGKIWFETVAGKGTTFWVEMKIGEK